jgi:hypothetical protein
MIECPNVIDGKECRGFVYRENDVIHCTACDFTSPARRKVDKKIPTKKEVIITIVQKGGAEWKE